jgi:hypothetical protein
MDSLHQQCAAKLGNKGCIADHPVLGPLSLRQWPRFHLAHTKHHMKQIVALKAASRALATHA